jgi:hypothetical protein
MKHLLQDTWHDLRQKRLWPAAVLLLIGLVAIPIVLVRPVKKQAPAPVPSSMLRPGAPGLQRLSALQVAAAKTDLGAGSELDKFASKNPFLPPEAFLKSSRSLQTATSGTSSAGTVSSGSGSSGGSGGSSGSSTGGSSGAGGLTGSFPAPNVGGRSGGRTVKIRKYTYVADVTFARNGRERRRRGLRRLAMLPSRSSPLLIFLGVDLRGGDAVFLLDSSLKTTGEGRCDPKPSQCAVLYLGAGSEQEFSDQDDNSYTLRIDEIRKVRLARAAASSRHRRRHKRASDSRTRRFTPPLLTDLIETVASPQANNSSARAARR